MVAAIGTLLDIMYIIGQLYTDKQQKGAARSLRPAPFHIPLLTYRYVKKSIYLVMLIRTFTSPSSAIFAATSSGVSTP